MTGAQRAAHRRRTRRRRRRVPGGRRPPATTGSVNFHALVAANVLRTVERELLDRSAAEPVAALAALGYPDEDALAAAGIRTGDLDDRGADALPARAGTPPAGHRHPGYDQPEPGAP